MTETGDSRSPEPLLRRRATYQPIASEYELDDATAISARRSEPVDDGTEPSVRRPEPVDETTALSVRRGGPGGGSAVGPRRSPAPEGDSVTQSAITSPTEPEVVDDTILRPLRPSSVQAATQEPAFDAVLPHRDAFVPTAGDLSDRRGPRPPEVAVASRAQTPSPRALDRAGADASRPAP
uniref:hypothetical protein n=1 Tax=Microbacterium sp. CPCC 204701 TaxID=2493084 RepID=UPI00406D2AF2